MTARSPSPTLGRSPQKGEPSRRYRNVARHTTRDLVFPTQPYHRRGHGKSIKPEGGPSYEKIQTYDRMAARTPLPPDEEGGDSGGWMDMEDSIAAPRQPAHSRTKNYRSALDFKIVPSEDQRREHHRHDHQRGQGARRERAVSQQRARSTAQTARQNPLGVATSVLTSKIKGLSRRNGSKGKSVPPPLNWNGTMQWSGT